MVSRFIFFLLLFNFSMNCVEAKSPKMALFKDQDNVEYKVKIPRINLKHFMFGINSTCDTPVRRPHWSDETIFLNHARYYPPENERPNTFLVDKTEWAMPVGSAFFGKETPFGNFFEYNFTVVYGSPEDCKNNVDPIRMIAVVVNSEQQQISIGWDFKTGDAYLYTGHYLQPWSGLINGKITDWYML